MTRLGFGIRFVHFSKENELRSRVFSEKMGLETGWNCHISLKSSSEPGNNFSLTTPQSAKCPIAVGKGFDLAIQGKAPTKKCLWYTISRVSLNIQTWSGSGTMSTLETQLVQRIEKESYGEKAPQWIKIFFLTYFIKIFHSNFMWNGFDRNS